MSGGGGSSTPQVQNSTTSTTHAKWYNDALQQQVANNMSVANMQPQINQQFMGGGTAPNGGVFNGGGTNMPFTPAQQPAPMPTLNANGSMNQPPQWTGRGGFPIYGAGGVMAGQGNLASVNCSGNNMGGGGQSGMLSSLNKG